MNPYRISVVKTKELKVNKKNYLFRILSLRYLIRIFIIFFNGKFKHRYPIKCPCGKKSWNPDKELSIYKINYYKCGKKHGRGTYVYT